MRLNNVHSQLVVVHQFSAGLARRRIAQQPAFSAGSACRSIIERRAENA